MKCPKCNYTRKPGEVECPRCGINYKKWLDRIDKKPLEIAAHQNDTDEISPFYNLLAIISYCLGFLICFFFIPQYQTYNGLPLRLFNWEALIFTFSSTTLIWLGFLFLRFRSKATMIVVKLFLTLPAIFVTYIFLNNVYFVLRGY